MKLSETARRNIFLLAALVTIIAFLINPIKGFFEERIVSKTNVPYKFQTEYKVNKKDIKKFNKIEKQRISPYYTNVDTPQYQKMEDYFFAENKAIINALDTCNNPKVHIIVAPAGMGKSFFAKRLQNNATNHCVKLDLKPLTTRTEYFENLKDLKPSNNANINFFSLLPSLKKDQEFSINWLLNLANLQIDSTQPTSILIDDIDEIHPHFAKRLLEEIKIFTQNEANENIMFFIFGRPESFKQFFKYQNEDPLQVKFYELNPPHFDNKGDLDIVIKDYDKFISKINIPAEQLKENLDILRKQFGFLSYTTKNLERSNQVIKIAEKKQDSKYTEENIKKELFATLIDRARDTHNRPNTEDALYQKILIQIAKKYFSKLDEKGYFEVNATDEVVLDYKKSEGNTIRLHFNVQNVLDRSGLVYLKPLSHTNPKYTFTPIWVHKYLALKKIN